MQRSVMLFFVLVLFLLCSGAIYAQGLKGGLSLTKYSGNDADLGTGIDPEYAINFTAGVFLNFEIDKQFSIRPEAYYSVKGAHYEETEDGVKAEMDFTMKYIDIPILAVFKAGKNFSLIAGPAVGFFLSGETKTKVGDESGSEEIESDEINSPDISLVFGANYFIGQLHLDARYSLGMTNIPDTNEDVSLKHSMIQILLGISF